VYEEFAALMLRDFINYMPAFSKRSELARTHACHTRALLQDNEGRAKVGGISKEAGEVAHCLTQSNASSRSTPGIDLRHSKTRSSLKPSLQSTP
jgi:hypothetical protein